MANGKIPGPLCQAKNPVDINDGTLCRSSAPTPGAIGGQTDSVANWDAKTKLLEAARRATAKLPRGMQQEFRALFAPGAVETTAAVLAAWGGSHLVGVGEAADLVMLCLGVLTLGWQAKQVADDLRGFVELAVEAKSEADLDLAAGRLARAAAVVGVTVVVSVILKAGSKLKGGRGAGQSATEKFWDADQFGPDFPGTSVPQGFTLKVAGRTFIVKPHAIKHMAEKSASDLRQRPLQALAAQRYQVDFPLSSLAGALEQAEETGVLKPLLQRGSGRIGTKAVPLQIGDWELAIELIEGRLEVFHANYKARR